MNVNPAIKALLCGVAVIGLLLAGSVVYLFGTKFYYMKSEYITADVILAADRFVSDHPGQWPRSWQDLGSEDLSKYTDVRFDLTADMLIHDRQLIYSAIQPKCHQYRTYPHARENLDRLYRKLAPVPNRK